MSLKQGNLVFLSQDEKGVLRLITSKQAMENAVEESTKTISARYQLELSPASEVLLRRLFAVLLLIIAGKMLLWP